MYQFSNNNYVSWPLTQIRFSSTRTPDSCVEWHIPMDTLTICVISSSSSSSSSSSKTNVSKTIWPIPATIPPTAFCLHLYNISGSSSSGNQINTTTVIASTPSLALNAHLLPQLIAQYTLLYHHLCELEYALLGMYAISYPIA
jgi:hypothetical protein